MRMPSGTARLAIVLAALVTPTLGYAHPDVAGAGGFQSGVHHPLSGMDHLLAMLAVGAWAAQLGGRARWAVPACFVPALVLGAALVTGGMSLPYVEQGIAASVLILGLAIAAAGRLPVALSGSLVAVFAVFHGAAHGAEMPAAASGLAYGTGMILATLALHLFGMVLGVGLQRARGELLRIAGAAMALAGGIVYLAG